MLSRADWVTYYRGVAAINAHAAVAVQAAPLVSFGDLISLIGLFV